MRQSLFGVEAFSMIAPSMWIDCKYLTDVLNSQVFLPNSAYYLKSWMS